MSEALVPVKPVVATLDVTRKCNLRCPHCSVGRELPDLGLERALKIAYTFRETGVRVVKLTGGEPLLNPGLGEIIDAFKRWFVVVVNTNGTLLSKADVLLEHRPCWVQVSVDGPREVHDRIRGRGAFDKTIRFLTRLTNSGLPVTASITVSKLNLKYVGDTVDFLAGLVSRVKVLSVRPPTRVESLLLTPEENEYLLETLLELEREYGHFVAFERFPPYVAGDGRPVQGGCGACTEIIHVDTLGRVYPCGFLRIRLGNILERGLRSVLASSAVARKLASFNVDGKNVPDECKECPYRSFCNKGCRAVAYYSGSGLLGRDPRCRL